MCVYRETGIKYISSFFYFGNLESEINNFEKHIVVAKTVILQQTYIKFQYRHILCRHFVNYGW